MKIYQTNDIPILYDEQSILSTYHFLKANVVRSRTPFSVVLLSIRYPERYEEEQQSRTAEQILKLLRTRLRQTDVLFTLHSSLEWGIILSQSGEEEAAAFLQRLYEEVNTAVPAYDGTVRSLVASVTEVRNSDVPWDDLLTEARQALRQAMKSNAGQIEFVPVAKQITVERVKVSILEDRDIFRDVLQASLSNVTMDNVQLVTRAFEDGLEFLESDWYYSSHTHIIIMNDILPRKNGLEVLHTLRKMPNNGKFIVFMMTKRNSEEDMIYAYENGVDQYVVKPFNLRLFEAQIKRVLARLWS
ncbi:response regulator [Paenibacillus sp. DMB20]|uniref:response regulator n=1 Tax=Paenibacillus sp. DMB20 TaxID=1642570 RepID=UPI000699D1D0|nr:response regulator [Paenibacillus sp. DMB20]